MTFQLKILGSNSATPAYGRHHTSQMLTVGNHHFLIDCGEATQIQIQRFKCRPTRINHIFISHLHGDHFLGLMGLIFTMHLLGRENELHIYGQKGLDEIITLQLKHSDTRLKYEIHFHFLNPNEHTLLYEDNLLTIHSFPLLHRVPCCGFRFTEKPKPYRINKDIMPDDMSVEAIQKLKSGESVYTSKGIVKYDVDKYTLPPRHQRSYSYCSDTAYNEDILPYITGSDLLYHEATFLHEREKWAHKTFHSTTREAATMAKKAKVGRLLIGHYSARYKDLTIFLKESMEIFPNTLLATEGESIDIAEE